MTLSNLMDEKTDPQTKRVLEELSLLRKLPVYTPQIDITSAFCLQTALFSNEQQG